MKKHRKIPFRAQARPVALAIAFLLAAAQGGIACAAPEDLDEREQEVASGTAAGVEARGEATTPAAAAEPGPGQRAGAGSAEAAGHYVVLINSDWGQTTPIGDFTLHPDGRFVDHWNEEEARWSYDADSRTITFTGGAYDGPAVTFEPATGAHGALRIDYGSDEVLWAYREPPGR